MNRSSAARAEPIAIVGAGCRFAGVASPAELWRRREARDSAIALAPADRWQAPERFSGGFLADPYRFDAERFGIADRDAAAIDPQQRVLLTVAAEALAGAPALDTLAVGVFVASGQLAYQEEVSAALVHAPSSLSKDTLAGNLLSMLATRLAHVFDWRGPALAVDSACSGSLVALHLACRALEAGECEAALVGGVNLNLTPLVHRLFERAGALSPSGRLLPFSPDGDGTLPADGAGVVLLESLARASERGHTVWAVVEGSAVNNCGRTIGVMAPRPEGQVAVMRTALARAGVAAGEVRRVEAHATGTELGDAVEHKSIAVVYPHGPALGAVKGIIGHALGASGIAGLIDLIGALRQDELGAVNSFGFGGTNAHVIVRGGAVPTVARQPGSAHSAGRVHRLAARVDDEVERALDRWVHVAHYDGGGGLAWSVTAPGESGLVDRGGYLVTGASGGLGREVARQLARNHRARLLLTGRRALDDELRALLDELRARGARAEYLAADLATEQGRALVCQRLRAFLERLDGVVHAAGGLGTAEILAKREGLALLDQLRAPLEILFSSVSAVLPGLDGGLEDYAAANRALDQRARAERAAGRRVLSVAWAPIDEVGMAAGVADQLRARGVEPLPRALLWPALLRALAADAANVVVAQRPRAAEPRGAAPRQAPAASDWRAVVRDILVSEAQVPAAALADDAHLTALGIDSLVAIDVVKALEERVGRALPTTFLFEHDTLAKLARALEREAGPAAAPPAAPAPDAEPSVASVALSHRAALPLLDAQRTFVVQSRYYPELPANVLLAATLRRAGAPGLERRAFERAVASLAARHLVLSSALRGTGDDVRQAVGDQAPVAEWVDAVDDLAIANRPFDLMRGPLIRFVSDGDRLVVNGHHLLIDAWSAKLVFEELVQLHERHRAGERFDDTAAAVDWWSVRPALGAHRATEDDLAHFSQRYADGVPPIALPYDGDDEAPPRGPACAHKVTLAARETRDLEELARREQVSLNALVLASYLRLLYDVSGQHDLTVRVAHGRREARVEGITRVVGSFADSLPVRVALGVGEDIGALARRVQRELAFTQAHASASSLALAQVRRRGTSGPAGLTPAGFSFLHLDAAPRLGELELTEVLGASASGFTRLGLIGWVFDGRLELSWNSLAGYFAPATVEALAARHRALLAGLVGPIVTAPPARRLDERLVEACRRHGESPLLPDLRFDELERASAALAARLSGERVALLAHPGREAFVGVLGALRAGAAYVPLDPDWPDARIAAILDAARPTALVAASAEGARAARLAGALPVEQVAVDELLAAPIAAARSVRARSPHTWLMFTSGSTGRPKGVCVSHDAALTFLEWVERVLAVRPDDRFLQTSPLGFGGSIRQMFSPMLAGARVFVLDGLDKRDPERLLAALEAQRITIYNSVPSLWAFLMDAIERRRGAHQLGALRWVLLGGEAVPAAHARRWQGLIGRGPRVANLYGSTETVVNASWFEVRADHLDDDQALVPIGWARHGCALHVEDEREGTGSLVVDGAIATGYLGGEPGFSTSPAGARRYATGDRVRRAASGALVYLGRADSQVQIYGNRVELGEVEATICAHEGVRAALVRFVEGRLEAVVEARGASPPEAQAVRRFVAERLPTFMVPHTVEVVRQLPRSSAGKAERRLPSEPGEPSEPTAPLGADANVELRAALATLWCAALRRQTAVDDAADFFAQGGDSMQAIDLVGAIQDRWSVTVSPLALHREPRFGALLAQVGGALAGRDAGVLEVPVRAQAISAQLDAEALAAPRPLGLAQRGFWLASSSDGPSPLLTASLPLRGPLDLDAAERALTWLEARHPQLRATFRAEAGGPRQRLGTAEPALLQVDDLTPLDRAAALARVRARVDEERALRLPLDAGPLVRLRLCRLAADEHVAIFSAHHIVVDAHSVFTLLGEWLAQLGGAGGEGPPPRAAGDAELGYALAAAGAPPPPDPVWRPFVDFGDVEARTASGHHARVLVDDATFSRLRAAAARRATTVFALCFAAFAAAVREVRGAARLAVATAVSGREHDPRGLAHAVGPFATGVPVLVDGEEDAVLPRLAESLAHARSAPSSLVALLGPAGVARLGRDFFSWLEPPRALLTGTAGVTPAWGDAQLFFETAATGTEVSAAALAHDGLSVHLRGGPLVPEVARAFERRLQRLAAPRSALILYAPADAVSPLRAPAVVETVRAAAGETDLVLLPLTERELGDRARLRADIARALELVDAEVVALAGMLPSLTGLAQQPLGSRRQLLTTGHAATVVAIYRTVELALARTGRRFTEQRVGVVGFGAIGRAALELCVSRFGAARELRIADPRFGTGAEGLADCDLILGASSAGRVLDVAMLKPGAIVVDDSFPRAFDDEAAWYRMEQRGDVMLAGGGMLDVGPLERSSPFAEAEAIRASLPTRWLPGCHAEALLVAACPELGPTVGELTLRRTLAVLAAVEQLGWRAAPLHLGPRELPTDLVTRLSLRRVG